MSQTSTYKQTVAGSTASVSIAPISGSIMAYLGTTDPDGWVIMDGVARTNDGRYNQLMTMGIGADLGVMYRPPNYKGAFLRGNGTSTTSENYASNALGTLQRDAIREHNHFVCDDPFFCAVCQDGTYTQNAPMDNQPSSSKINKTTTVRTYTGMDDMQINLLAGYDMTKLTSGNVIDEVTSFISIGENRPFNYSVNWILKL